MSLSDFSIKNPVFAVMLSAAMVVFGYLGYKDLGISQFPELDFPVVSITTYLDAAAPETMDVDVTDIIEDAVSGVEGIDYVQSQSLQGVSVVTVYFHLHRDIDVAMQDVQNAVSAAASRLPNEHAERPAGSLQSDWVELNVRTMGEARTAEEFRRLPVATRRGQVVRMEDVAVVEDGLADRRTFARFNFMPNVGVGVMRATGANVVAVCDAVKERLPQLRKLAPPDTQISISTDYSMFIKEDIAEVKQALFSGVVLTAIVTFLFLGSLGTTLNVCVSIPTSLIGTFIAMPGPGLTV